MNYRRIGKTGLSVSEVGFGAWGIGKSGWIGASDDESVKALHRAIDLGLNFIDTALGYGDGHSERLVGRLAKERSETIYVATKIPPKNGQWPAQSGVSVAKTFPAEHVIACTEEPGFQTHSTDPDHAPRRSRRGSARGCCRLPLLCGISGPRSGLEVGCRCRGRQSALRTRNPPRRRLCCRSLCC